MVFVLKAPICHALYLNLITQGMCLSFALIDSFDTLFSR